MSCAESRRRRWVCIKTIFLSSQKRLSKTFVCFFYIFSILFVFIFISDNGKTVVVRSCFWQELNNTKECINENYPKEITVESCTLCNNTDGCNNSSRIAIHFGQIVTLMAIPLAIAKIFSF